VCRVTVARGRKRRRIRGERIARETIDHTVNEREPARWRVSLFSSSVWGKSVTKLARGFPPAEKEKESDVIVSRDNVGTIARCWNVGRGALGSLSIDSSFTLLTHLPQFRPNRHGSLPPPLLLQCTRSVALKWLCFSSLGRASRFNADGTARGLRRRWSFSSAKVE